MSAKNKRKNRMHAKLYKNNRIKITKKKNAKGKKHYEIIKFSLS